jgi:membrane-bound ClpP family serine protease
MDSYAIFAFLLLFAGIAVLAAEVFIPSGGLLFCVMVATLAASVCCAYAAWWKSNPQAFWGFCGFLLMMIPAGLVGAFTLLPKTKFGKRILLDAPELEQVTPFAKESARLEQLVGRRGTTQTLLNPGGMVNIDGERLHAFTDGLLIEPGQEVEVAEVRGTRLLVRIPLNHAADNNGTASPEPAPLDFEIPQG